MSAENIGTKKTLEVLNLGGTMTSEHIDANEQLICWACSQAIVQASSGNPVAATMILEGLVYSLRGPAAVQISVTRNTTSSTSMSRTISRSR
jgi:hypothetical protein